MLLLSWSGVVCCIYCDDHGEYSVTYHLLLFVTFPFDIKLCFKSHFLRQATCLASKRVERKGRSKVIDSIVGHTNHAIQTCESHRWNVLTVEMTWQRLPLIELGQQKFVMIEKLFPYSRIPFPNSMRKREHT